MLPTIGSFTGEGEDEGLVLIVCVVKCYHGSEVVHMSGFHINILGNTVPGVSSTDKPINHKLIKMLYNSITNIQRCVINQF